MKIKDFDFYKDFMRKNAGLYLSSDQPYVLSSRLTEVAKDWGFKDLNHMTIDLHGLPDDKLVADVTEAMTDPETSFFRDPDFFESLREQIIPDIVAKKSFDRKIKIWCAGCSTGQEAYSIAILFKQAPLKDYLPTFKLFIDATDISSKALKKAESGTYSQLDVQNGLPVKILMEHFEQQDKTWVAKDSIKTYIHFDYFNLINSMKNIPEYDLILCRNVLEDFDHLIKSEVLDNFSKKLSNNGYIALAPDESVKEFTDQLSPVENVPGLYQKAHK